MIFKQNNFKAERKWGIFL